MSLLQVQSVAKVRLGNFEDLRRIGAELLITPDVQIRKPAPTRLTFPNLLILTAQTAGEEIPPLPIQTISHTRSGSLCLTTAPEATPKIRLSPGNQQKRNSKGNEASHHNHLDHSDFVRHVVPGGWCRPDPAKAQAHSSTDSARHAIHKRPTATGVRCRNSDAGFAAS